MKTERQTKILEIIAGKDIETQEELTEALNKGGFPVTQATVSRDIREMKLTKVSGKRGKQHYVAYKESSEELKEKYHRILKDGFISAEGAGNILVIKTVSGMAMAVAAALDDLEFPEIVGTIAGDDTIMSAIRTEKDAAAVIDKIHKMISD